jgi:hypothetical protein
MTPKEKAKELVEKYKSVDVNKLEFCWVCNEGAKQLALIAVNELIIEKNKWENGSFYTSKYWDYVKQEIEKL